MSSSRKSLPSNTWHPRYWLLHIGFALLRLLSLLPLSIQLWLGRRAGDIAHAVAGSRRRIVDINLQLCFPDWTVEQRVAVRRDYFRNMGASLFETASAWWRSDALFEPIVTFRGEQQLRELIDAGYRIILLTGHFSTLEISGRFLRQVIPEFDAVYRPQRNPYTDTVIRRGRLRSARRLIEKADIRQMLRSLKEGVSVWYAPDQSYRRKYAELIDFFGTPAMTNTATGRLAALSGAKVIPVYCWREGDGPKYTVEFLPPLEVDSTDMEATTRAYIATLESAVQKAPAQYFWIHRKFKGRPEGYPDVYANTSEA
ncbi:MAG: lysophospholipid acyltransferase family protein [Pseudomonadota bacterium]